MRIRARDVAADQVVIIDGRNWLVQRAEKAFLYGDDTSRILLTLEKTGEIRALICRANDLIELLFPVGTVKTRAEDILSGTTIVVDGIHWDVTTVLNAEPGITVLWAKIPQAKGSSMFRLWNNLLLDVVA